MASDNEACCESDPNFAVICGFLEKFGVTCGLANIDFLDLQDMLENSQEVPQELVDLHVKLLRKARKSVSSERWERAIIKLCHGFCIQDAWEIERFGYKKARLSSKLRILKELLEMQFDYNAKFKNEVNKLSAEELRTQPLGRDRLGHIYWFQSDNSCQIRVYKEDPDEETWSLVAKDREGLVGLITQLSDGKETVVNEDSNSLETESEKPVVDTGQTDSNSNSNSSKLDQLSTDTNSEETQAEVNTKEEVEDKTLQDQVTDETTIMQNTTEMITPTKIILRGKKMLMNEDSNKATESDNSVKEKENNPEQECKSENNIDKDKDEKVLLPSASPPKTGISIRIKPISELISPSPVEVNKKVEITGVKEKYIRSDSTSSSSVYHRKAVDSAGFDVHTNYLKRPIDEEEDVEEPSYIKRPRLDRPTLLGNKKKKPYSDEEEEVEDEEEEEDEVTEEITEPLMLVRGEGSGQDNEGGNCRKESRNVQEDSPIVGEAIEESVLFFYGEGLGHECETGNDNGSDKKDVSTTQQKDATQSKTDADSTTEKSEHTSHETHKAEIVDSIKDSEPSSSFDEADCTVKLTTKPEIKLGTIIDVRTNNLNPCVKNLTKKSRWDIGKPEEAVNESQPSEGETSDICATEERSTDLCNNSDPLKKMEETITSSYDSKEDSVALLTSKGKVQELVSKWEKINVPHISEEMVEDDEVQKGEADHFSAVTPTKSMFFFGPGCLQVKPTISPIKSNVSADLSETQIINQSDSETTKELYHCITDEICAETENLKADNILDLSKTDEALITDDAPQKLPSDSQKLQNEPQKPQNDPQKLQSDDASFKMPTRIEEYKNLQNQNAIVCEKEVKKLGKITTSDSCNKDVKNEIRNVEQKNDTEGLRSLQIQKSSITCSNALEKMPGGSRISRHSLNTLKNVDVENKTSPTNIDYGSRLKFIETERTEQVHMAATKDSIIHTDKEPVNIKGDDVAVVSELGKSSLEKESSVSKPEISPIDRISKNEDVDKKVLTNFNTNVKSADVLITEETKTKDVADTLFSSLPNSIVPANHHVPKSISVSDKEVEKVKIIKSVDKLNEVPVINKPHVSASLISVQTEKSEATTGLPIVEKKIGSVIDVKPKSKLENVLKKINQVKFNQKTDSIDVSIKNKDTESKSEARTSASDSKNFSIEMQMAMLMGEKPSDDVVGLDDKTAAISMIKTPVLSKSAADVTVPNSSSTNKSPTLEIRDSNVNSQIRNKVVETLEESPAETISSTKIDTPAPVDVNRPIGIENKSKVCATDDKLAAVDKVLSSTQKIANVEIVELPAKTSIEANQISDTPTKSDIAPKIQVTTEKKTKEDAVGAEPKQPEEAPEEELTQDEVECAIRAIRIRNSIFSSIDKSLNDSKCSRREESNIDSANMKTTENMDNSAGMSKTPSETLTSSNESLVKKSEGSSIISLTEILSTSMKVPETVSTSVLAAKEVSEATGTVFSGEPAKLKVSENKSKFKIPATQEKASNKRGTVPVESTNTTNKRGTTAPSESTSTTNKYGTAPLESASTTKKHSTTPVESTSTMKKHDTASVESTSTTNKHGTAPVESTSTTKKHDSASVESTSATNKCGTVPVVESTVTTNKHGTTAPVESISTTNKHGAVPVVESTNTTNKRDTTAPVESASTTKKQSTIPVESTSTTSKHTAPVESTSATNKRGTVPVVESTNTTNKRGTTAPVESPSTTNKHDAAPVESASTTKKRDTASVESTSTTNKHSTAPVESASTTKKHGTAPVESPSTTKKHDAAPVESASTTKKHDTASVESPSTTNKHDATSVESASTTKKCDTAPVETASTTTKHGTAPVESTSATIKLGTVPVLESTNTTLTIKEPTVDVKVSTIEEKVSATEANAVVKDVCSDQMPAKGTSLENKVDKKSIGSAIVNKKIEAKKTASESPEVIDKPVETPVEKIVTKSKKDKGNSTALSEISSKSSLETTSSKEKPITKSKKGKDNPEISKVSSEPVTSKEKSTVEVKSVSVESSKSVATKAVSKDEIKSSETPVVEEKVPVPTRRVTRRTRSSTMENVPDTTLSDNKMSSSSSLSKLEETKIKNNLPQLCIKKIDHPDLNKAESPVTESAKSDLGNEKSENIKEVGVGVETRRRGKRLRKSQNVAVEDVKSKEPKGKGRQQQNVEEEDVKSKVPKGKGKQQNVEEEDVKSKEPKGRGRQQQNVEDEDVKSKEPRGRGRQQQNVEEEDVKSKEPKGKQQNVEEEDVKSKEPKGKVKQLQKNKPAVKGNEQQEVVVPTENKNSAKTTPKASKDTEVVVSNRELRGRKIPEVNQNEEKKPKGKQTPRGKLLVKAVGKEDSNKGKQKAKNNNENTPKINEERSVTRSRASVAKDKENLDQIENKSEKPAVDLEDIEEQIIRTEIRPSKKLKLSESVEITVVDKNKRVTTTHIAEKSKSLEKIDKEDTDNKIETRGRKASNKSSALGKTDTQKMEKEDDVVTDDVKEVTKGRRTSNRSSTLGKSDSTEKIEKEDDVVIDDVKEVTKGRKASNKSSALGKNDVTEKMEKEDDAVTDDVKEVTKGRRASNRSSTLGKSDSTEKIEKEDDVVTDDVKEVTKGRKASNKSSALGKTDDTEKMEKEDDVVTDEVKEVTKGRRASNRSSTLGKSDSTDKIEKEDDIVTDDVKEVTKGRRTSNRSSTLGKTDNTEKIEKDDDAVTDDVKEVTKGRKASNKSSASGKTDNTEKIEKEKEDDVVTDDVKDQKDKKSDLDEQEKDANKSENTENQEELKPVDEPKCVEKKVALLTCVDINKLKVSSDSTIEPSQDVDHAAKEKTLDSDSDASCGMDGGGDIGNGDSSDSVEIIPESDPLACSDDDSKEAKNPKPAMTLATFKLDLDDEPVPITSLRVTRKRAAQQSIDALRETRIQGKKTEIENKDNADSKRPKLKRKRSVDRNLRRSIEEKKSKEISSSEEDATRTRPAAKENSGKKSKGIGKRRISTRSTRATESPTPSSDASRTDTSNTPPVMKQRKPRQKTLLGLEISAETENLIKQEGGSSVRQSRRIAQIKIKEEAERRKIEEMTLQELKEEQRKRKGKKEEDKDYKLEKKKRSKILPTEDETTNDAESDEKKKRKRKRKHRDPRKHFDALNPWKSSSGSSSSEIEEEEEEIEEYDDCQLVFKSDHEFSPESDLEEGAEVQPLKRARTARKESDAEEEVDDCACQKCGQKDHPEWILLCDSCDSGWHCSCLRPALLVIPEGDWFCPPCQHATLVKNLEAHLVEYDKRESKRLMETRRKERLAYVGISLDNVLAKESDEHRNKMRHRQRREENQSDDSRSEDSGSESDSSSSSDSDSEPIYQLRERRQAHSYRFNDYDELINSAIQDELDAVKGAGNQGRGKDISTIVNAEKEEEALRLKNETDVAAGAATAAATGADDVPTDLSITAAETGAPEPLPPVVPVNYDKKPDDESDDEPIRPVRKSFGKKKHRKLNSLDVSSGDDADSDEDFKGSSSSDSEEDFDDDEYAGSESSDTDTRRRKRRKDFGPVRRSTRARISRYDRDFINDDDSDSEVAAPRRKKTRSLWDESESEESDRSWGRKKRKSGGRSKRKQSRKPKKSKKKKKKRAGDDSDPEVFRKRPNIKFGGLNDDEEVGRRTRGKKINYLEALGTDSEEEIRRKPPRIEESEEEYMVHEDEAFQQQLENNDKDSDESGVENVLQDLPIPEPRPKPRGRGKAGLKIPRKPKEPLPPDLFPPLMPDIPQPLDLQAPILPVEPSAIQPQLPPLVTQPLMMDPAVVPEQELQDFEDEPNPIEQINKNVEEMNEQEMEKMMEEEDYANKQLQLVALQIEKEKKRKEREAKRLEKLVEKEQKIPKKRGRKPKNQMLGIPSELVPPPFGDSTSMIMNSSMANNAELSEPPGVNLPMFSEIAPVLNADGTPKKRRGRGKGKKTLAAEAAAIAAAAAANKDSLDMETGLEGPASSGSNTVSPAPDSPLHGSKLGIATPPQPFSQSQPAPSVITRMLQSQPGQGNFPSGGSKYFSGPPGDTQLPPNSGPFHPGATGPRGSMPGAYQQPPPGMSHYPVVRSGPAPPHRLHSPGPPGLPPMYHSHRSMDPSPSGGGPINVPASNRDRHSPAVVAPASSSPLSNKGDPTPPPPPYTRPQVGHFPPVSGSNSSGTRHVSMVPPHLQQHRGSSMSPYHPGVPPNYYGSYPGPPPLNSDDGQPPPVYPGSAYPEPYPEGGAPGPPPENSGIKPFDEDNGGEFVGLVSYFSSQREDDLET